MVSAIALKLGGAGATLPTDGAVPTSALALGQPLPS
jgi:hypothetical protein